MRDLPNSPSTAVPVARSANLLRRIGRYGRAESDVVVIEYGVDLYRRLRRGEEASIVHSFSRSYHRSENAFANPLQSIDVARDTRYDEHLGNSRGGACSESGTTAGEEVRETSAVTLRGILPI